MDSKTVKTSITFLEEAEVLICGSTLFACDLALRAARAGKRTVLAMERTNPFYEGISCLRSWVDEEAGVSEFTPLLGEVLSNEETSTRANGRAYFNPTKAALDIEDLLCEAGVRFYYNAPVAVTLADGGRLCGVGFGGEPGLFAVESSLVIDATPNATIARAAGVEFVPSSGPRHAHYVVELSEPAEPASTEFTAGNGIAARVDLHHYYACFDLTLPEGATGPLAHARDFERIYQAALEFSGRLPHRRFRGADACLTSGADVLQSDDGRVPGFENLFAFGPLAARGNRDGQLLLKDPLALFRAFPAAAEVLERHHVPPPRPRPVYEVLNHGVAGDTEPDPSLTHSLRDPGFCEPGAEIADVLFAPPEPVVRTDLVVAGCGTSGAAAAYQASKLGIETLCVDRAAEVGGTNTVGGVTNLFYGNPTKGFEDFYTAIGAHNDGLNAPAFFSAVKGSGAQVLLSTSLCGVAVEGEKVRCLYVVTPDGLAAVSGTQFIDATGDGSLAAWAGCPYTFGCERDDMTLWASFASFRPGRPEAKRQFLTPGDERSPSDTTRVILSMRRNVTPQGGPHISPPFYIAPRETRHITGHKTVTFLDVLAGRKFADGVFRAISPIDTKGVAASDLAKAGFIPSERLEVFEVTIPFAAMVPLKLDNVIIAGKAYSITSDALAMARMQRDLFAMGLVAGQAAKLVFTRQVPPRDVPIPELQAILMSQGLLRADDLAADDRGLGGTADELAARVAAATSLADALTDSARLLLADRRDALRALGKHAGKMTPALGRLLCFMGDARGIDYQLAELERMVSSGVLPMELYTTSGTPHLLPDHGFAPLPALMINNLALASEERVLPILGKVVEGLDVDSGAFNPIWGYTYSLAYTLERLARPEGAMFLKRVMAGELFQDRLVDRNGDLRGCSDIKAERLAYLRLCLSRALARCGDVDGCLELCTFLNEARVCFARSARAELAAVTGQDFGFDADAWGDWLKENRAAIGPVPLRSRLL